MKKPHNIGAAARNKALQSTAAEIGFTQVGSQRLRYAHFPGKACPVLLCNGIGANLELALELGEVLNKTSGHPVVMFDMPGCGESPVRRGCLHIRHIAELAAGVMDAMGYQGDFFVAGVSWGGGLAQKIAWDFPHRVRGLILMATTSGVIMLPGKPKALINMVTPRRYASPGFMHRIAGEIYGGEMRRQPERSREFARLTMAPHPLAYIQQLLSLASFSSLPWLHHLRCPTLIMGGDDDPLIRITNLKILAWRIPHSELHVLKGGGHLFMVLQPQVTAQRISQFLALHSYSQ